MKKVMLETIMDSISDQIAILDQRGVIKKVNKAWREYNCDNSLNTRDCYEEINYFKFCSTKEQNSFLKPFNITRGIKDVLAGNREEFSLEYPCCFSERKYLWFEFIVTSFVGKEAAVVINHRKITRINQIDDYYEKLFYNKLNAFALHEMIFDAAGKAIDYIFLEVNQAFEKETGLMAEELIGRKVTEILPTIRKDTDLIEIYGEAVNKNESKHFVSYSKPLDKWFEIFVYPVEKNRFITNFLDITERRREKQELIQTNKRLDQQLIKGKKIHQSLLPKRLPEFNGVKMASHYFSADVIGADFYQTIELEDQMLFYISDVTGHNLDGAFLNIFLRETINAFITEKYQVDTELSLVEIIKYINYRLQLEDFPDDLFISLLLFVLDKETNELKYINAGSHIAPLLIRKANLKWLNTSGPPIAKAIKLNNYKLSEQKIKLNNGDSLLLSTDGLIEAEIEQERYGKKRLEQVIKKNYKIPPELFLKQIILDLEGFIAKENIADDITLLALSKRREINRLELAIESKFEKIREVKDKIFDFIQPYYQEKDYLLMAVHEAAVNAIKHGNCENYQTKVDFKVIVYRDSLVIEIIDEGKGFAWNNKLTRDIKFTDLKQQERGLALINQIADSFGYNQKGNKAVLYFKRNNKKN